MADSQPDFGSILDPGAHAINRAVALTAFLRGGATYAKFLSAYRDSVGVETIVIELQVEVPQVPVHLLNAIEHVAVRFRADDRRVPEVLAIRRDFPRVPHLNLTTEEYPKSLCLYDRPWSELRLRWTPASFVERIREWMALTARGELHGDDQPLEPLLLEWEHVIVLPSGIQNEFGNASPIRLYVDVVPADGTSGVLVARGLDNPRASEQSAKFVAVLCRCEPQKHGVIHRAPRTLDDLHSLADTAGLNLKMRLQEVLRGWREHRDLYDARLIVLLWLPKVRNAGAHTEASDLWAFALHPPIRELGAVLQAWAQDGKHNVPIIGDSPTIGSCDKITLSVLNPVWTLTSESAARCNGTSTDQREIVAIGAGALGSQLIMNLIRSGYGSWTVIDNDSVYPHNLARHALDGFAIGWPKVTALAHEVRSILDTASKPVPIVADYLEPGDKAKEIEEALTNAKCVLDVSASVPVARSIARLQGIESRRVSMFLNPSGADLVMLAEDEGRNSKLDHLEHQFYRELLTNSTLIDHFARPTDRVRYAHSCRDVSSTLPQHCAALHAAIGSKAFRDVLAQPEAAIRIWHSGSEMQVVPLTVVPQKTIEYSVGDWTLCMDDLFLCKIRSLRLAKLPNETGGVLIGSFDQERRVVYLVDTIPSPPDSKEWPTLYIRGSKGLEREVKSISERTAGMLQYVGEWHSHPRRVPPLPSGDDCTVFAWLTELMDRDGFPAIMLIAGDEQESVYVCRMLQGREPL